jgi:hypothetical protein
LRTRIYELALADSCPRECDLEYDPLCILEPPQYGPGHYGGLTQVNRLLRTEFLPLYREALRVTVRPCHLAKYLETFPLEDRACSEYIRSVLASVPEEVKDLPTGPHFPGIDILPFLSLDWTSFPFDVGKHYEPAGEEEDSIPIKLLTYLTRNRKLLKDLLEDKVFSSITMSRDSTCF